MQGQGQKDKLGGGAEDCPTTTPTVLTIAGSDSSSGAGIQADLKTCGALGVYCVTAITAITAQNTERVSMVQPVSAEVLAAQIDAVLGDIGADAVKTGMLVNADLVDMVIAKVRQWGITRLVIDPVIVASTGRRLLDETGLEHLRDRLLGLAYVVTPNAPEAAILCQRPVTTLEECKNAATQIGRMGARNVVITGGHLAGAEAVDVLFDGHDFVEFSGPRLASTSTHGTGCTFSAALAAYLALGRDLAACVALAKDYVASALASGLAVGRGAGPLNHFWRD